MILRWDLTLPTEALKGIRVEDIQQSDNEKFSANEMAVTKSLSQALGFKYTEDGIVLSNFSNFTILQNLYAVNPSCNLLATSLDVGNLRKMESRYRRPFVINMVLSQLAVLPYIIVGITVLASGAKGLYWLVPAVIFSFLKAILDAWVLLVEINR